MVNKVTAGLTLAFLRGCLCLMPENGDVIPPSSNSLPGCTCKWIETASSIGKQMKLTQDGYKCEGTIAFPDKYAGDDCCCCTRHCLRQNRCTIGQCADMGIDIGQEELDAEFSPGPRVHNALYTRCSKKYSSRMWAQIACLNDEDCEYIQDYNCDDKAWRYCGKMDEQFSGDEKGCTLNKKWTPGPQVANNLLTKCSNSKYGSLAWAQTTCEADPGCDWIHDWQDDGNAWRFCGSKAQIQPGDKKAASMFKTLGDGLIRLRDSRYAGAALSVEKGGNKDKGRVWMWSITKDEWQTWEIRADGTIRLKAYPDYALSMEEGGCRNQGGVHMARINDGDSLSMNVVWKVHEDGTIRPKAFDKCPLAIQANQHRDRGRVWMWGFVNKDVWQTWGGIPKAIPKGPPQSKKKTKEAPPDEDEEAENPKDADQEDEEDPKKARLYLTWKATGCPNLPSSSWGGWAWYLKQKDGTVLYDIYQWCVLKSSKHRAACCAGKSCKPKCRKQKKFIEKGSLLQFTQDDEDDALIGNSTANHEAAFLSYSDFVDEPEKDVSHPIDAQESLSPEAQSAMDSDETTNSTEQGNSHIIDV